MKSTPPPYRPWKKSSRNGRCSPMKKTGFSERRSRLREK